MSLHRGSWLGYIMGNYVVHGNGLLFLITVKGTQSTAHSSHLLSTLSTYAVVSSSWFVFHGLSYWNLSYMLFTQIKQHARKVMFDSLGLVDFVIRLMNFVPYLPNVQSNFIVITNWLFFRLVKITFRLLHASYSFKTDFSLLPDKVFNCVLLCDRYKFNKYKIISVDKIYFCTMIKWSLFSLFRNLMVIMTSVLKMFFSFYWLYKGKQLKQVKATLYTSYHSQVYPLLCTVYIFFYSYNKFWICGLHPKGENYPDLFYFILLASPKNQKT